MFPLLWEKKFWNSSSFPDLNIMAHHLEKEDFSPCLSLLFFRPSLGRGDMGISHPEGQPENGSHSQATCSIYRIFKWSNLDLKTITLIQNFNGDSRLRVCKQLSQDSTIHLCTGAKEGRALGMASAATMWQLGLQPWKQCGGPSQGVRGCLKPGFLESFS